ncbi:nucleotide sugar dehydrogenase [Streptomyces sp. NPDC058459]|uniref:nucleotide sugar dehydrogenase n=1 Tax=Streptomyces sp. NPDC058459 TaxID=3346508 RepID=UPI00365CB17B
MRRDFHGSGGTHEHVEVGLPPSALQPGDGGGRTADLGTEILQTPATSHPADPDQAAWILLPHTGTGLFRHPETNGRSYDTAQVFGAIRKLAPHLGRPCTIVGKSTVSVGTTAQVTALTQRLAPAGKGVEVVWNPEFLREGHAVEDTLRPDRLIAGVTTAEGEKAVRAVYAGIIDAGVPIFITDPQTAELAKGAANTYLGLKISYINAVADMCEAAGGDVAKIVDILGIDPRIGSGGMRPGIGYGGGCLPKDVRAFTASARALGADAAASLLRAAEVINERRTDVPLGLMSVRCRWIVGGSWHRAVHDANRRQPRRRPFRRVRAGDGQALR